MVLLLGSKPTQRRGRTHGYALPVLPESVQSVLVAAERLLEDGRVVVVRLFMSTLTPLLQEVVTPLLSAGLIRRAVHSEQLRERLYLPALLAHHPVHIPQGFLVVVAVAMLPVDQVRLDIRPMAL